MSTAEAILSAPNHPASLIESSTSISGASSISSLDIYSCSTDEKSCPNSTALVVERDPVVSSSSLTSSRDAYTNAGGAASAHQPALPIVPSCQQITRYRRTYKPAPTRNVPRAAQPHLIATISVGFERGDYLVREEKGFNVYFYFLEEAYNFIVQKGYSRMPKYEENDYMELIKRAQKSVPGGCRYNNGKLLMVLKKKLVPVTVCEEKSMCLNSAESNKRRSKSKRNMKPKNLSNSSTTLPTDDESVDESSESASNESSPYERSKSSTYEQSSCSTSYVDSWE
eukprot:scaffold1075_cov98-Skeletonema_marinoi.AAC.1